MIQDHDTEVFLLGLAMNNMECAEKLVSLPEDSFSFPETLEVFKTIRKLMKDHNVPDATTVFMNIPASSTKARQIAMVAPSKGFAPSMYAQYEQMLLDLRKKRNLKYACIRVANAIDDPGEDVDLLAGELSGIINDTGNKPTATGISDAVMDFYEDLGKKSEAIYTGIAGLDRITGGFHEGTLNILGARPKVGKTALALSIALNVARKSGPVLIVSLEMTEREIMARVMSSETGINMQKFVTKNLDDNDWISTGEKVGEVSLLPVRFCRAPSPLKVRREAAAMLRNGGLKLIVIDYIQLMRADESKKSRYEEVSSISRELKLMAMDLNVPILALTQFNRESEQGGQRRKPSMAEARDSGSIEQDCNMFLIQYPPTEPEPSSIMHEFWDACQRMGSEFQILEVAANRQGPTGNVMLQFDKSHMDFITLRRAEE